MSRPDQSITFLRGFGYSVFRFPRASAQPLELMHRDDDSGEFLTTQQLPAGDAAVRELSRSAAHPHRTRGPVFLETRGAFVRVAQ